MNEDAFVVLEALGRGARARTSDDRRWIEAFKTIRWVVEGENGPILTAEGRRARDQMALDRPAALNLERLQPSSARRAALG
jgi:hypothetical protein